MTFSPRGNKIGSPYCKRRTAADLLKNARTFWEKLGFSRNAIKLSRNPLLQ